MPRPAAVGGASVPRPAEPVSDPTEPFPPPKGYRQLRKGRSSNPGFYYFITTNLMNRRPLLKSEDAADEVKRSIHWMEEAGRWTCISYVLMPDHIHLVIRLGENSSLPGCMKTFKSYTANRISKLTSASFPIWQDGYFDHRFRTDGKFFQVLFYVFWNPVEAGLVEPFSMDYPHWDCREPYRSQLIEEFPWLKGLHEKGTLWSPERRG